MSKNSANAVQLSDAELALIQEEEDLLRDIKNAIDLERKNHDLNVETMRRRFHELQEATVGVQTQTGIEGTDLPMLFEQMHYQLSIASRRSQPLPNKASPYFARMTLEEQGKKKIVLLGYSAFISRFAKSSVIDWRHAPIARVFFQFRCEDEYELELPGRIAEGVVLERNIVSIENGQLIRIKSRLGEFEKDGTSWRRSHDSEESTLAGGEGSAIRGLRSAGGATQFGTGVSTNYLTDVVALLDQQQYELLTEDPYQPLLILGGAGSGKTTVAIHRIAALTYQDPKRFRPENILVIVPEPGLVHLSLNLLRSLGIHGVHVLTFDDWIDDQRRKAFKDLPKRICNDTPSEIVRFKRHPAIYRAIEHYLSRKGSKYGGSRPSADAAKIRREFFSDKESLLVAVAASGGALLERHVDALLRHNREQHLPPTEQTLRGTDLERMVALDGQDLDFGTPDERRGSIDVEDFPILFEIMARMTGSLAVKSAALRSKAQLSLFNHLAVDEAQEFAEIELSVLSRSLRPPLSITIAGDAAQHTDRDAYFPGWDRVIDAMGIKGARRSTLMTNYRSPGPIAELGKRVLGDLADNLPDATRQGAPVRRTSYAEFGLAIIDLIETLSELRLREPRASIAIVARTDDHAIKVYRGISEATDSRLVLDGDFSFKPGIDVTPVHAVKGLEFDYVVVPDADLYTYPDDPSARRALYVAVSRAMHQLWLMTIGPASPLI